MKTISLIFLSLSALFFTGCSNDKPVEEQPPAAAAETTPPPAEFADAKYVEIGKKGVEALSAGDVDGWMSSFADNAVYVWNYGDSLAGKPAITDYWKKRRGEVIESLSFNDAIWLPININQPQSVEQSGVWLLCWYKVTAKYKATGKEMTQWIHADMHFNAEGKIDRFIQYLDRTAIMNAQTK